MKGLELAEKYYKEHGEKMLEDFPLIKEKIAVGLIGEGSECLGYDDEISADHDFEPGFIIFVPDNLDSREEFKLERAYAKLPNEFMGYKRQKLSPVGGNRKGVIRLSEFLTKNLGVPDGKISELDRFKIPDYNLLNVINGKIFYDGSGEITRIREELKTIPQDVLFKKLAGNLLLMAQSGQYNYLRSLSHNQTGAAQLAVFEFVKSTMATVFLLNGKYMPFYKWSFKAMRELPVLNGIADVLEFLITTENGKEDADTKYAIIEDIAGMVIEELMNRELTKAICGDLEKHAYSVNDKIGDPNIRNLNILYGV